MNFEVVRNNIADMKADAIVCPSNTFLAEGSGASKAIYEKAGKIELKNACKKVVGKAKVGSAVATPAFNLDACIILHAIVPKWKDGNHNEYALLSSVYEASLDVADKSNCESIAFPLLASGNKGFDKELAYEIAEETIAHFEPKNKLNKVFLVVYDVDTMAVMRKLGIEVKEQIDEIYVLSNDERYNHIVEAATEVMNYLNDPENREKFLEHGKKIADLVIMAGTVANVAGKGGKIVKTATKVGKFIKTISADKKAIDVDIKE